MAAATPKKKAKAAPKKASAKSTAASKTTKKAGNRKRSFHKDLVLNRWLLGLFEVDNFHQLKARLNDLRHEGIAEDGQTHFFHELTRQLIQNQHIPESDLRRYDLNIIRHWQAITEERNKKENKALTLKYFQYLTLLFTEVYLDYYFHKKQAMQNGLDNTLDQYHKEADSDTFQPFVNEDLNKLAFWNATGSGKTLLMHVNIKQYLEYSGGRTNNGEKLSVILVTPNEGLSKQHLDELHESGFHFSHLFKDTGQGIPEGSVAVIDINKLGDKKGEKTVPIERFGKNNLILIDEAHRGTGKADGAWMKRREALINDGFAFEYSATFGQAVAKGKTVNTLEEDIRKKKHKASDNKTSWKQLTDDEKAEFTLSDEEKATCRQNAIREIYAKCILFDYSYKFFYEDGYGKESLILNMDGKLYETDDNAQKYFTACLLSFYQQMYLWKKHHNDLEEYNIAKPLWVFVGHSVVSSGKLNAEDQVTVSDVGQVIHYLAYFLNQPAQIKTWLKELVNDKAQLLDTKGHHVFQGRFVPLMPFSSKIDQLYDDILKQLFNATAKQRLKVVNLKNAKGEIALRVGTSDPFGVINIGDDTKFINQLSDDESFDTENDDFQKGLFNTINHKNSHINVLIGSRKFTEGWSSWRVSTMGLLNLGKNEGSQIIQLFGRGVRLKGKELSLKRTVDRPKDKHLDKLETLNVFGVKASYMAMFKDYLKEEGITPSDEIITLDFKIQHNLPENKPLKALALKDGYKDNQKKGFKRTHYPWLYEVPKDFEDKIKAPHVTLDLYPRLEALGTVEQAKKSSKEIRYEGKLDKALFNLFDFERIYLALQAFKLQHSWSNLRLDKQKLIKFCKSKSDWYTLYMPEPEFTPNGIKDIKRLEDILIQLLIDYTERFYQSLKTSYEGQFFEVITMHEDHGSMLNEYKFEIEATDTGRAYESKILELQKLVAAQNIGEASEWSASSMVAICFDNHLFYPLLSVVDKQNVPLKMTPLAFDAQSEINFVKDLKALSENTDKAKKVFGDCSLYLLRNSSVKSKGIGFSTAGNFYPDFLLWLVNDKTGEQWLTFIDPKGIRQINLSDPKFGLYKEIKTIEANLAKQAKPSDPKLTLNAFILSDTRMSDMLNLEADLTQSDLEEKHILFMDEGADTYLPKLFDKIGHQ